MIGISAVSSFFSETALPIGEISGRENLAEEERVYFDGLGIENVREAQGYSAYDLTKSACEKLLDEHTVDPAEIDIIIYIKDRLPEYLISSSAARLQYDIKAVNAISFSIGDMGCADMTMAIKLAKEQLTLDTSINNVLVCYGHKQYTATRYRYPVTINGDGGIALLIGRTASNQIKDIEIKMSGKYWDLFQVDYLDKPFETYEEACTSQRNYGFELPIVTKMKIDEVNTSLLNRNSLELNDIDHYVLQNLSQRAYDYTESSLNIRLLSSCGENLKKYGHLGPLDVILNYQTGIDSGTIKKGDKVLIMNNSPVAAWSTILMQV